MQGQTIFFQELKYRVTKLLGKGKSAYSWLCEHDDIKIVLKQMHDEPCSYYEFTDKMEAEIEAYQKLKKLKVTVPEMLDTDDDRKWIFKEYIHGKTAAEHIAEEKITDTHLKQLFQLAAKAGSAGFNPDFFPTNFIISCSKLYYIDYELNPYDEKWNLQNWGIYYWLNSKGMHQFLQTGDGKFINQDPEKGIPIKDGLKEKATLLIQKYKS